MDADNFLPFRAEAGAQESKMQHSHANPRLYFHRAAVALCLSLLLIAVSGCATKGVTLREVPKSPLVDRFNLTAEEGPKASDRTMQILRVNDLVDDLRGDPRVVLAKLQEIANQRPSPELTHALAELSFVAAKMAEPHDVRIAMDLYGASVLYAYQYLFDESYAMVRNPYDPQFRESCDLYNGALEGALRLACASGELVPGHTKTIQTAAGQWDVTCVMRGSRWRAEDFERFEFVSDYEMNGLTNHYRTHGMGVPLIAVRRSYEGEPVAARYYPEELSFPVTAFLRPIPPQPGQGNRHQAVLELYDPLTTLETNVAGMRVPLESDVTTPLAFFLSDPKLDTIATVGLLKPDELLKGRPDSDDPIMGLYMVQPYEPGKIPVLFVHGLWSSPMTWMEMFNDLRSSPEIRDNYQFWFYLYPTGQPFWISAAQMRADLAEVRRTLDPQGRQPALDQMVLVGHSMGGLVSRLQTIQSRDNFWQAVSSRPFDQITADQQVRGELQKTFFFNPDPSVRRVVTIGTPHRGSEVSNNTTQWLLGKLISLPQMLVKNQQRLFRDNPGAFPDRSLLRIENSIDSLAPDSPILPVMLASHRQPWVKYHNVIGLVPPKNWVMSLLSGSDGVVSQESAHMEDVVSELTVAADHSTIHSHPATVLEVRRVLHDHLNELRGVQHTAGAIPPNQAAPQPLR